MSELSIAVAACSVVMQTRRVKLARIILLTVGAGLSVLGWAYWTAISDPVVREVELALLPLDSTSASLRVLLMTDIHVAGPDMPPSRLERIVGQANALKPDMVVITGDLVSDKLSATRIYSLEAAIAPLARLESRLGVFAVLGNHDHWRNATIARRALKNAGIRVLDNSAVAAGPLAVGGLDDRLTGHEDLGKTLDAMGKTRGVAILLSHSPDPFPELPSRVQLMLAGHTHCGQIRVPLLGAYSYASRYGDRYGCGVVRENGKTLIVSAGLGTSILPLRIGAVPDMWLITLRKPTSSRVSRR